RHSPSRGHAASPAPSKPPMQTPHTATAEAATPGLDATHGGSDARGGRDGRRRAGKEEVEEESNNKRTTITSVSPPSKTEQNCSNSRTENQPDCLLYQY
ncbi:hypothetical protein N339_11479, partial [Pterocles gutturalis]